MKSSVGGNYVPKMLGINPSARDRHYRGVVGPVVKILANIPAAALYSVHELSEEDRFVNRLAKVMNYMYSAFCPMHLCQNSHGPVVVMAYLEHIQVLPIHVVFKLVFAYPGSLEFTMGSIAIPRGVSMETPSV